MDSREGIKNANGTKNDRPQILILLLVSFNLNICRSEWCVCPIDSTVIDVRFSRFFLFLFSMSTTKNDRLISTSEDYDNVMCGKEGMSPPTTSLGFRRVDISEVSTMS